MLPTKFRFIFWPSGFRGEDFKKSAHQKQELPVAAMFANGSGRNEQSLYRTFHWCFLPSFVSFFGQAVSEEKIFKNRPIRNKNCLWRPCLLMDRDKMSNFYKGSSIDSSYQVSVYLAEGFQRRRLKCEKLTDAKWWQKLTLPLARWAKKGTVYQLYLLAHGRWFFPGTPASSTTKSGC
jgi:hypothetical protein